jgi:hypothetical protein
MAVDAMATKISPYPNLSTLKLCVQSDGCATHTKGHCHMPTHQQNQNRNHDNNQKNQVHNQNQKQANQGQDRGDMRQANQGTREQGQDRTGKDALRRDDSDNL